MGTARMTQTVTIACKLPNGLRIGDHLVKGNHAAHGNQTLGGYAFTDGFPRALWDQWYNANEQSTMVQNNLIFADVDPNNLRGKIYRLVGPRRT